MANILYLNPGRGHKRSFATVLDNDKLFSNLCLSAKIFTWFIISFARSGSIAGRSDSIFQYPHQLFGMMAQLVDVSN